MKRRIALMVFLAFLAAGVFAQKVQLSAGGGALMDLAFNNGLKASVDGGDYYWGLRTYSFGGFVFFDATYAEATVSLTHGWMTSIYSDDDGIVKNDYAGVWQLGLSLLFKYPIDVGSLSIFPLLGFSYNHVMSFKLASILSATTYETNPSQYSQWGVMTGAGLDIPFSASLYLKAEALFHMRFDNMVSTKGILNTSTYKTTLGMGPCIKIGVGYRF